MPFSWSCTTPAPPFSSYCGATLQRNFSTRRRRWSCSIAQLHNTKTNVELRCTASPQHEEEGDGSCRHLLHCPTIALQRSVAKKKQEKCDGSNAVAFFAALQHSKKKKKGDATVAFFTMLRCSATKKKKKKATLPSPSSLPCAALQRNKKNKKRRRR